MQEPCQFSLLWKFNELGEIPAAEAAPTGQFLPGLTIFAGQNFPPPGKFVP
jgi:hypothetical protein